MKREEHRRMKSQAPLAQVPCWAFVRIVWVVTAVALAQGLAANAVLAQDVFSPKDVRIVNPGASLNSPSLDYAPAISADGKTLFFVSDRAGSKKQKSGVLSHDFWSAQKTTRLDSVFLKPFNVDTLLRPADNGLNTSFNEGVPAISTNRRVMYFTGCDRPDVLRKKKKVDSYDLAYECDIYVVELNDKGEWGIPRNLGTDINSEDWDGQPSLNSTGDRLYFASTRPGGYGDADIWYSDYDFKNRKWGKPKNAGASINTKYRDWSPFIAANNRELFFASDGHTPNYGGTDFYVSLRNEKDQWSVPRNLGKPINTDANEAFLSTPAQRDVLYFSSERKDVSGVQGSYDVFMAFVPKSNLTIAAPLVGTVTDGCSGLPTSATITVFNPLTKRQFRDVLDNQKHTTFETVINDFDFGSLDKPADTLRLQIFADNPQYGRAFQELVIKRPSLNAAGTFDELDIPPVNIQYGSRAEFSIALQAPDTVTIKPRRAMKKALDGGAKGLVMEEVVSISVNRVLNYIFFEESTSAIAPRYVLLSSTQANAFQEEQLRGETLDKYYHVLNVYGSRLKKFPKPTITIVGCVNDTELRQQRSVQKTAKTANTSSLAQARAEAVFAYFKTVWGISEKRMKIVARELPSTPSNREDSLGNIENRRVEILCDDWDVVKPVVDRSPFVILSSPALNVSLGAPTPSISPTLASNTAASTQERTMTLQTAALPAGQTQFKRRLVVTRNGKIWRTMDVPATSNTVTWNWRGNDGELPPDNTPLEVRMLVIDQSGRQCLSAPQAINVRRITTEEKKRERITDNNAIDRTLERYNLIMFPFDKSDVGPMNSRILREYVLPRLFESSDALVVGHTDVIGETQYNQTLSQSRGGNAKEDLARLAKSKYKTLESKGVGEEEPLFDNRLPEGRFYNRTVQVIIETPVTDAEK